MMFDEHRIQRDKIVVEDKKITHIDIRSVC